MIDNCLAIRRTYGTLRPLMIVELFYIINPEQAIKERVEGWLAVQL